MVGRKHKPAGSRKARKRRSASDNWLGAEIELVIRERQRLLHAAGAAADLFATLDIRKLPSEARQSMCRLGATLASLSDETLSDAMEQVLGARRMPRSCVHS